MAISTPPNISARIFYGLRTEIQYNAHYLSESEILYPAGGVLVIHNHLQKKQKFIRLPDKHKPIKSLVLAPNRRWLALNEIADEGQKPIITIYDLTTYKRRKVLSVPFENCMAKEFAVLQFTHDSRYLIAISGDPDYYLYYYNWDKGKVESHAKAQNPTGLGYVDNVQCSPSDSSCIVVTGPYTFRIMTVLETVWRQWGWSKVDNIVVTACVWLSSERIMFGTKKGQIMVVEDGELRQNLVFNAIDIMEISLKMQKDIDETTSSDDAVTGEVKVSSPAISASDEERASLAPAESTEKVEETYPVTNFVNFPKGFAYGCGPGLVHMFEKETIYQYRKRNLFRICRKSYKHTSTYPMFSPLDVIQHIAVDPNQETLLITTLRRQLYYVKLFGLHMLQNPEILFAELGPAMHHGPINCLSMCAWKPIFMTSGAIDKSIRIWNYMTDDVELIRIYQDQINCLALHPTGLFAIVGFTDALRFMVVLIDDFEVQREFNIKNCKQAKFSTYGHLFAAVNGQVIQVFSSISFDNMFNLKGHPGKINYISWSANDLVLISCGMEGEIYEWNMSTGQRVGEIQLNCIPTACVVNSIGKTIYSVGNDGQIKEIGANAIRRSLRLTGATLNSILLSRSDMMLFMTGGEGGVISIQLPLLDTKAIFNEFHMHNKIVMGLALSYDDQTLVSVSEDSSICLWRLTNADGRAVALDKDFAYAKEILISKIDLQEKLDKINQLTTKMTESETEHAYMLKQAEAQHAEKLQEVHEGYQAAIEELKEKGEQLDADHCVDLEKIQKDISELKVGHAKAVKTLESDFNMKLINEYDRYQTLEDKTAEQRKNYEQRLEDLTESQKVAIKELKEMFEARLAQKELLLQELKNEAEQNKSEHEMWKSALEEDADREILEIKTTFEVQLKDEKDANIQLRGETGAMKKRLILAHKDIEDLKETIANLRAEHITYQRNIKNLESDVVDLKKEIGEREMSIQDKENQIYELRRKKQELEKYKFVLNFKIIELRNQIEPKQRMIAELTAQIEDMENEELKLEKIIENLDMQILRMNEKLLSAKKDLTSEEDRVLMLRTQLKKIKVSLHNMLPTLGNLSQLKLAVKDLYHSYIRDIDFIRDRLPEDEAVREYNRERDHYEKQLSSYRASLSKALSGSKTDIRKIMDENILLLGEVNALRTDLKQTRTRVHQMETIIGTTTKFIPPNVARVKLKKITEERVKLDSKFHEKVATQQHNIKVLKEENEGLLSKIRTLDVVDDEEPSTSGSDPDIAN